MMSFYQKNKNEITTLQLISQILGKIKLEYAVQEPQWAHVVLDITSRGFSTGLLKCNTEYFEIETDLSNSLISISTSADDIIVELADGKSIREYYTEIIDVAEKLGLNISINTKPQEMETKVHFEEDDEHHHYNENTANEILKWFQFAWNAEQLFIGPLRKRKVYPGLFWGTFDVSCILIYKEHEPFPDDSLVIERAAFDEHMVEFGFWLGDDNFEYPTLFTLPYPFVEDEELTVDDSFPQRSSFSPEMAEYLYEFKDGMSSSETDNAVQFFEASFRGAAEYLKWKNTEYCRKGLKMRENNRK